jgi:hypothetical protein
MAYSIKTTRSTAALYLVWEYGFNLGNRLLKEMARDSAGLSVLPLGAFGLHTKKEAEGAARRVETIAAWQLGRLRKSGPWPFVKIERV